MPEIVKHPNKDSDPTLKVEVFEQICNGNLHLGPNGDIPIRCAVLENETRIISSNSTFRAFGRPPHGRKNEKLPPILSANNIQPYFSERTRELAQPIYYRHTNQTIVSGYNAEIIPEICDVYEDAYEDGALQHSQESVIPFVKAVRRVLSRIGMTALVDEVTGFQYIREKKALEKLLDQIITSEYRPWTKRFPLDFFKEIYRLYGWNWNQEFNVLGEPKKPYTPSCVGNFINKYIYNALGEEVLKKLRKVNPKNEKGNRPRRFTSHLSEDIGIPALQNRITRVLTVMELSNNMDEFKQLMDAMDQKQNPRLVSGSTENSR